MKKKRIKSSKTIPLPCTLALAFCPHLAYLSIFLTGQKAIISKTFTYSVHGWEAGLSTPFQP